MKKYILTALTCCLLYSAVAQNKGDTTRPPNTMVMATSGFVNGSYGRRMDSTMAQDKHRLDSIRKRLDDDYYFTIWFNTTSCNDGFDYQHGNQWVQSYFDSTEAYQYYFKLRTTGKVLIWNKMPCVVDTETVFIDRYVMRLHKYIGIKQPK